MSAVVERPRQRLAGGLGIGLVIAAAVLLSLVRDFDSDLGWHLAAGELILKDRSVAVGDVFSWTAVGEPFINHEWLWDVAAALLHRMGGFELLIVIKALCVGAIWLALAMAGRARGAGLWAIAWALLWALLLARYRFQVKPEVVSLLLVVVFDWLAERWLRRGSVWTLVLLVALSALWANLHLLVVLGFAVLGAHACGEWLGRRLSLAVCRGQGSPVTLLGVVGVGLLATLVNPYGVRLYQPVLEIHQAPGILGAGVREWQPPSWSAFGPFFLLAPLAAVVVLATIRRIRPQDALLWLGMMFMAGRSMRHIGAFAIVAAPVLAWHLTIAGESIRTAWRRPRIAFATFVIGLAACVLTLLSPNASFWHQDQSRFFRPGLGLAPASAPIESTDAVLAAKLDGPVFNSWELGGYLIWRAGARLPVFLDGRGYVYEKHLLWLKGRSAPDVLRTLDLPLAFVGYRDPIWLAAFRADGRYRTLFFDDSAVVLIRDDRLASRPDLEPYAQLRPEDLASASPAALSETTRAVAALPEVQRAWLLHGAALRKSGDAAGAIAAYLRAIRLDPRQASAWNNLGIAQWEAGRDTDARRSFARALLLDPALDEARRNLALRRAVPAS